MNCNLPGLTLGYEDAWWDASEKVYAVYTPYGLIQAAGYVKYNLRSNSNIFFRGQCHKHKTLRPGLFRKQCNVAKLLQISQAYCEDLSRTGKFTEIDNKSFEPLLQQYGLKTSWIDVVDNIWSALWFSCHTASFQRQGNSAYIIYKPSEELHSYIHLVDVGKPRSEDAGVIITDKNFNIANLREIIPSHYIRPHTQHGLLIRRSRYKTYADSDISDCIVNTLRVDTAQALKWIGVGFLSTAQYMFPLPTYDAGYSKLLRFSTLPHQELGNIPLVIGDGLL